MDTTSEIDAHRSFKRVAERFDLAPIAVLARTRLRLSILKQAEVAVYANRELFEHAILSILLNVAEFINDKQPTTDADIVLATCSYRGNGVSDVSESTGFGLAYAGMQLRMLGLYPRALSAIPTDLEIEIEFEVGTCFLIHSDLPV